MYAFPMISILISSKIHNNPSFGLFELLDSILEKTDNLNNIEILIKFDIDDPELEKCTKKLEAYQNKILIKYIAEGKYRGYIDIHFGYIRAMSLISDSSTIVGCMADDFIVTKQGWDTEIIEKSKQYPDNIFILHQRPHPTNKGNYEECNIKKFDTSRYTEDLTNAYIVDECPFWGRKLLEIISFWHVSFTDGWTIVFEKYLFEKFNINRTLFLDDLFIHRRLSEVDLDSHERWDTERKWNMEFINSKFFKDMVVQQAKNVFLNIKDQDSLL